MSMTSLCGTGFDEAMRTARKSTTKRSPESKLTKAFRSLRRHGYFAKQKWQCCQSCGWSMVPDDKADKVVFYHSQDAERMHETDGVYLAWSGDGNEIKTILEAAGLTVEWDGKDETRIRAKNLFDIQ